MDNPTNSNQIPVTTEAGTATDDLTSPLPNPVIAPVESLDTDSIERKPGDQPQHGRVGLTLLEPAGFLGSPDPTTRRGAYPVMPAHIKRLLCRFSPSHAALGCVPQTPAIDTLLADSFAHEYIPPHYRCPVADSRAYPDALALIDSAILIHQKALYNSRHAEDASAWHPIVRQLLTASYDGWLIPSLLAPDELKCDDDDFLQAVNVTTKTISALLPPAGDVTLDIILVFDARRDERVRRALSAGVRLNVFSDANVAGKLVVLGCAVKTATGPQMDAQYQLGVYGMKTLHLTRGLVAAWEVGGRGVLDVALGVDVCGHVWSFHLTYWRADGALVTHGPVVLGSTDTLVGTLKIVRWMCIFQVWSEEAWVAWMTVLDEVTGREL